LTLGVVLKRVITEDDPNTLVSFLRPYGVEETTQLGLRAGVEADTTDRTGLPTRGARFQAGGTFYPATAGLRHGFGEVHGEATAYLTAGATLALRAGGKRAFGTYPFYEAAFLGGHQTLRGLRLQRYAGDGMLHGSAELYLPLRKVFVFVPGELGLLGIGDVGRVFLKGEDSRRWHSGLGGGLYFASPLRNNLIGLLFARSEGRNAYYLRLGLAL
jgi:outer membrane protein assembly factor BamA